MLSNNQVDKLGGELRDGRIDEDNLRRLELFRSEFVEAYTYVENILVCILRLSVTGRPSKSTVAILEKLKRETARLSQIQDIAGCRVIVQDMASQNKCLASLRSILGNVYVDDKRNDPKNGYRAVHVIIKYNGRPVEVQLRTKPQHAWAEISEKFADAFGQSIKYGEGEPWVLEFLSELSMNTARIENLRLRKVLLPEAMKYSEKIAERARLGRLEAVLFKELQSVFDRMRAKVAV